MAYRLVAHSPYISSKFEATSKQGSIGMIR